MNSRIRCFLFQWYWVLALLLGAIAVVVSFVQSLDRRWEISAGAIGVAASLVYFIQKQKLDEIKLFHELFKDFNARYAKTAP
jgi:hypothetical protein